MVSKILVIALGGTIGSERGKSINLADNTARIVDFCTRKEVEFEINSPFSILSEHITRENWKSLIDYLNNVDFDDYKGVIILHGSDTLAYTSSIVANAFPNENIVLVASNKPIDETGSNAVENFNAAVEQIQSGNGGVFVSYDSIMSGNCITSADIKDKLFALDETVFPTGKRKISNKNVLIIKPYPEIDMSIFDFSSVDEILFEMYHSATVPKQISHFCKSTNIPYHFVTHCKSADYETASDIDNIIFSCTIENAFAISILE